MKKIILFTMVTILFGCGKESGNNQNLDRKSFKHQRELMSYKLPIIKFNMMKNVRIEFESNTQKKEFYSPKEITMKSDFLKQHLKRKLISNFSEVEFKDIEVNHNGIHIYNTNILDKREMVESYEQLKKIDREFNSTNITFDLSLKFENLARLSRLENIYLSLHIIDTKNWTQKKLLNFKLVKNNFDEEIITPTGQEEIIPRYYYPIKLKNLDREIMEKLMIGEYQMGFSLSDAILTPTSEKMTLSLKELSESYYLKHKFLYILKDDDLFQYLKVENEDWNDLLKEIDPEIEFKDDGSIHYLLERESDQIQSYSLNQLLNVEKSHQWRSFDLNKAKSKAYLYLSSKDIRFALNNTNLYFNKITNFKNIDLSIQSKGKMIIATKGKFKTPKFEIIPKRTIARISKPQICVRDYDRISSRDKDCMAVNLNCHYSLQRRGIDSITKFSEKNYQDHLLLREKDSKNKFQVIDSWYSDIFDIHFTIISFKKRTQINLSLNEKLTQIMGSVRNGVIGFSNCISRTHAGFHLPGVIFPARIENLVRTPEVRLWTRPYFGFN